jgi:hypothetical protein
VVIDGVSYFIFYSTTGLDRQLATSVCDEKNTTLISFEGDEDKWRTVNEWLMLTGKIFTLLKGVKI